MSEQDSVLCVFSKVPIPGQVKTRLIPELGEEGACELYKTLLSQTLSTARDSSVSSIHLYCTQNIEHAYFRECAEKFSLSLCLQEGSDLGERMCKAIEKERLEYAKVIIVGSDCPWIRYSDIDLSIDKLESGSEVVLGPAEDGGYYLIAAREVDTKLFEGISWGTSTVLNATRAYMRERKMNWFELPTYPDVDRPEDLRAYEKLVVR